MATARENTIFSLNKAAQRGADFVELDVQLTKVDIWKEKLQLFKVSKKIK